jgi:Flp pilus assembly protein TadG
MGALRRRGSYGLMFLLLIPLLLGFGALAIDLSIVRLAQAEAQAVADAASQAGLTKLRATGSTTTARIAVEKTIAVNRVDGRAPVPLLVQFGIWDGATFTQDETSANAVRVRVGQDVNLPLARLLGVPSMKVQRQSTSASRALHVVLVMDITNSWSQSNFANARTAAIEFLDTLVATAGPKDRVGMALFTGQYGVEFTPMVPVKEVASRGVVDQWSKLRTASKAGYPANNTNGCTPHTSSMLNNFTTPAGGCFPNMWREYADESGTDHTTGMTIARSMFTEQPDEGIYRAMVTLTDGTPNGTGNHTQRAAAGFVDKRWRFYKTNVKRTTNQVINDTKTLSASAWNVDEIHQWGISFVDSAPWMQNMAKGDGYYVNTTSSSVIVDIFTDIAESLPLAVVE